MNDMPTLTLMLDGQGREFLPGGDTSTPLAYNAICCKVVQIAKVLTFGPPAQSYAIRLDVSFCGLATD